MDISLSIHRADIVALPFAVHFTDARYFGLLYISIYFTLFYLQIMVRLPIETEKEEKGK